LHQIFAVNSCHVSSNTSPGLLPKSYHLHHQTPIPISCSLSRCSENCFIHYLICKLQKVHYLLREERWENGVVPFFKTSVQEVWSNFTPNKAHAKLRHTPVHASLLLFWFQFWLPYISFDSSLNNLANIRIYYWFCHSFAKTVVS